MNGKKLATNQLDFQKFILNAFSSGFQVYVIYTDFSIAMKTNTYYTYS